MLYFVLFPSKVNSSFLSIISSNDMSIVLSAGEHKLLLCFLISMTSPLFAEAHLRQDLVPLNKSTCFGYQILLPEMKEQLSAF